MLFYFKNRRRQTITTLYSTFASLSFKVLTLCVFWCLFCVSWIFYCFKLKREYYFFYCSIEIYNFAVFLSTFAMLQLISSVIPVISLQSHILRNYALVWEDIINKWIQWIIKSYINAKASHKVNDLSSYSVLNNVVFTIFFHRSSIIISHNIAPYLFWFHFTSLIYNFTTHKNENNSK